MEELNVKPEKRIRWSFSDKLQAALVVIGFILTALWFAFPSSAFINQVSLTVAGDKVRFIRELPYGTVTARWRSEITLIDGDGFECQSGGWRLAEYQMIKGNTVTYKLGPWGQDCLDAGPPFYLTTTRQVLLLGVIPLRPDSQTTEVQGERPRGQSGFSVGEVEG